MLDLAFERAGGTVVMQCEIDPWCRQILTKHWPNVPKHTDMKTLEYNGNEPIDIIFGGIPCQPFSQSGKRNGMSDDRHLWPYTRTLIEKYRPTWVLIENVSAFIGVVFDTLAADLEALCYKTEAIILPACAIGTPHVRERACIIARLEYPNSTRRSSSESVTVKHKKRQSSRGLAEVASVANTDRTRRGTLCTTEHQNGSAWDAKGYPHTTQTARQHIGISESRMGRTTHGDTARLDGTVRFPAYQNEPQHEWEAPRVIEKRVKDHAKRLKALGNGVVVPLWQVVFKAIILVDDGECWHDGN